MDGNHETRIQRVKQRIAIVGVRVALATRKIDRWDGDQPNIFGQPYSLDDSISLTNGDRDGLDTSPSHPNS